MGRAAELSGFGIVCVAMYMLKDIQKTCRRSHRYHIARWFRQGQLREIRRLPLDCVPTQEWLGAFAKADKGELVVLFDLDGYAIEWERAA